MEIEPNRTPPGESCNTCRFAGTHTCAEQQADQVRVTCRRYPPQRLGRESIYNATLASRQSDTDWPVLDLDGWCGEWRARISYPECAE